MNLLTIVCSLSLALPLTHKIAETTAFTMATHQATPEAAFTSICNDAGSLMRRAFAEPNDAKVIDLLQNGMVPLLKRKQQLQPAFKNWIKNQSPAQRQAFAQRMMQSNGLMKFLMSVENDAKANARIEHNGALAKAVTYVTSLMHMDGM